MYIKANNGSYRVAEHVGQGSASEDDDFVVARGQHVGQVADVHPRVVVVHVACGLVVALPGDPGLEPGLAVGHGESDHLQGPVEELDVAADGAAVELEDGVDGALRVKAERVGNVDVAAPGCAAGAPCRRRRAGTGGGGEHPHGRDQEPC